MIEVRDVGADERCSLRSACGRHTAQSWPLLRDPNRLLIAAFPTNTTFLAETTNTTIEQENRI